MQKHGGSMERPRGDAEEAPDRAHAEQDTGTPETIRHRLQNVQPGIAFISGDVKMRDIIPQQKDAAHRLGETEMDADSEQERDAGAKKNGEPKRGRRRIHDPQFELES